MQLFQTPKTQISPKRSMWIPHRCNIHTIATLCRKESVFTYVTYVIDVIMNDDENKWGRKSEREEVGKKKWGRRSWREEVGLLRFKIFMKVMKGWDCYHEK